MITQNREVLSFYPRPLPLLAVGVGAGIVCGRALIGRGAIATALLWATLALFALLWGRRGGAAAVQNEVPATRFRRWALPLLLFGVAGGILRVYVAYPALPAPREACTLTGIIAEQPREVDGGWELTLRAAGADGRRLQGRVLLRIAGQQEEAHAWQYGEHVQAQAALSLPQGKRGDGGRDWRSYYLSRGVAVTASAKGADTFCSGKSPLGLYGRLLRLRQYTTDVLVAMIGSENGTLAAGILHGDTGGISEEALSTFRGAGIAHLLAVSGLHVGILVGALLFLLRRARHWVQLGVLAGILGLYCLFTALSPSTLRASLMALCMLLGRALGRRNDQPSSISLAFLLILLVRPFSLFSVGLQLSFTAVLGILLLSPVLKRAFAALPGAIAEGLAAGIAGQAGILPATAAYFGQMPLLAVAANVVIIPLAGLIVLPAMLGVLCYPLLPGLASAIASVAGATLDLVNALAGLAAGAGAFFIPAPNLAAGVLFFVTLLLLSPLCRGPQRAKRRLAAACAGLMLCCWLAPLLARLRPHITVLEPAAGGEYVAHLHTRGEDRLLAGSRPRQAQLERYLAANGVYEAQLEFCGAEGVLLRLGEQDVFVGPGYVEGGGQRYETARSGQVRLTLQGTALRVRAVADDVRYAILIKE